MRQLLAILILLVSFSASFAADKISGNVVKVLPFFLDLQGRNAVSPSLFDRDSYQTYLHEHEKEISTMRFDVLWKATNAKDSKLKLRAELRGVGAGGLPKQKVLEAEVTPGFFRSWTSLKFDGDEYKKFGEVVAWRVTLWSGDDLLAEQKSFLW